MSGGNGDDGGPADKDGGEDRGEITGDGAPSDLTLQHLRGSFVDETFSC